MKYKVNLKKTDEGYSVWAPGLPGCRSQGETESQTLENIKDAIQSYLQTAEELSRGKESRYVEIAPELRLSYKEKNELFNCHISR